MHRPVLVAASLISFTAFANAAGAIGYSGAPGTGSCNDCHTGGGAPTVNLTGPMSLPAGGTGNYTLTVNGGTRVGVNIAITQMLAALNPISNNLGLAFRELYQVSPQNSGAQFQFSLTAPPVAGPLTIYATGNAVNGNSATSGDRSANTTLTVNIMPGSGAALPVIVTAAAAQVNPLSGKSTQVTIEAADDGGPTNLTYIWSATGPGPVVFTPNSSNAAAMATATFSRGGMYMITCTVRDSLNQTVTSQFALPVSTVLTGIKMTPYAVRLARNATQTFTALAVDQFETPIDPQPTFTYEVPAGGGVFGTNCVNACTSNVFRAQANAGGPFTVVSRSMGIATSSTVTVDMALPAASDTTLPTVSLVQPESGAMLMNGLVMEAIASDPAPNPSGIAKVQFTIAEIPVGETTSPPWTITYNSAQPFPLGGKQPLVAVATDLAANIGRSSSVVVDVPPPPATGGGSGTGGGTSGTGGGSAGSGGTGGGGGDPGGCACGTTSEAGVLALGLALVAYAVSRRRVARQPARRD